MTVIGALSSFRELGEMSLTNGLIAINSRIVGNSESVVGRYIYAFIVKFALLSPQQSNNSRVFPTFIGYSCCPRNTICAWIVPL